MARYKRHKDETEMQALIQSESDEDINDHGTFSNEERPSRDNNKTFRFMVLGRDDDLMNEACAAILGLPQENARNIGTSMVREGEISGRRISVLKTPSYWLDHLKSHLFFSRGVKSMKNDMEFCESMLFPGPHAFLLVLGDVQNSRKEHLLLQALKNVFGEEAIDYTMVLIMRNCSNKDIVKNKCVKQCKQKFHILEKKENSTLNLLEHIERMTKLIKNSYFTKHSELLDKAQIYFQEEFDKTYKAKEHSLKSELAASKLKVKDQSTQITKLKKDLDDLNLEDSKIKENQLRKDLDDSSVRENQVRKYLDDSKVRENQLRKDLDDSKVRENQLRKDLDDSKIRENQLRKYLDDSSVRENQVRKYLDDSKVRENQLRKDLDDSKVRENQLRKDLDDSKVRENQLRKDLDDSKVRENQLRKDLDDLKVRENQLRKDLDDSKVRENQLRKDLDDSKVRENQLRKDLDDLKVRQNQLKADNKKLKSEIEFLKEKEMCEIQRDVDKRKIELETKEKESALSSESEPERYSSITVPPSADKTRAADEGDRAESRDEASQASGSDVTVGLKPVRRNSKELEPPFMSESEHGPLHNL